MIAVLRTHQGKVRANNQDSLLARDGKHPLYVVADGMGGHLGGNVASAMAVEVLAGLDLNQPPAEAVLKQAFMKANTSIWERQLQDLSLSGMGTTLTAIWEDQAEILLAHVGDSRAYCLRQSQLHQISTDHSLVGELLRSGAITAQMARNYPYRNIVTRAVGTDATLQPDLLRYPKQPGWRYLICSDGLTEYADTEQLARGMALPLEEAADVLLAIALDGGGRDNITLILLEVPS
ncbi:MAG: Stp1/IreP family PP2C-type Ser/Thr phosphatase [Clostridiales bacterium]|nr:Stp1/IreP family PP2C-type Ser/Thr phosphatase [Clostridiales bacterium]